MAAASRRGCSPLSCAARSNSAATSAFLNRRAYIAVVMATPCFSMAGAVALTISIAWADAVRIRGLLKSGISNTGIVYSGFVQLSNFTDGAMQLTLHTDLGLRLLIVLARGGGGPVSLAAFATEQKLSYNH